MTEDKSKIKDILKKVYVSLNNKLLLNNDYIINFDVVSIYKRPYSIVAFVDLKTKKTQKKIVIKNHIRHSINIEFFEKENQAYVEFNILNHLYSHFFKFEELSVPKPIILLSKYDTYVMDYVEGELFMDKFKFTRFASSRSGFSKLKKDIYLYGKWLKEFQNYTKNNLVDGKKAFQGVFDRAIHRLNLINMHFPHIISNKLCFEIQKFLQKKLLELKDFTIQIHGRHGDFTPLNAIVSENNICVIDFLGYDAEPISVDFHKVMIFLENEMLSLSSSFYRVLILKRQFIKGYGKINFIPESGLIISETMQRIVSIWGQLSTDKKMFHHMIQSKLIVYRHLQWIKKSIKR